MPDVIVYSFDTDPTARHYCANLAKLNFVSERVRVKGLNVDGDNVDFDSSIVDVVGSNCRTVHNKLYANNYGASVDPLTYGLRAAIEGHNADVLSTHIFKPS
jgi:hypothetical protein